MKKNIATSIIAVLLAAGMTTNLAFAKPKAKKQKVTTLIVGTSTDMRPYCYLDEKGNLTGYEIEVIKAIDNLLPQYSFTFETYDFKNILLALAAGKIDVGAHQFESNPERRKNYLFTEEGYNSYTKYIEVLKTRNDINSWDDLIGKTVTANTGSATATILKNYNDSVPENKRIKVILTSGETKEQFVAAMKNGTYDAAFNIRSIVDRDNREWGNLFKIVDEEHPISTSLAYLIFNKDNGGEIKKAVDGALKQLIDSGELSRISIRTLGGDYTHDR